MRSIKIPMHDRRLWLFGLDALADWPERLPGHVDQFVLLLACDATGLKDDEIRSFVRLTVRQGLTNVTTWGPGCERMHDLFDLTCLEMNEEEGLTLDDRIVMTQWYAGEPLDKAIGFFLCVLGPDPESPHSLVGKADTWIGASVGSDEWTRQIENRLGDPWGDWWC